MVDIQGCGDLYTDPQIHTLQGTEYGDGNLGVKVICLGSQLSYLLYLFCGPIVLYPSFCLPPEGQEEVNLLVVVNVVLLPGIISFFFHI